MRQPRRLTAVDRALIAQLGDSILLGDAFAFVKPEALNHKDLGWVRTLFGVSAAERKTRIVPLTGPDPVDLPGARVAPVPCGELALDCVTSDRMLYRESHDTVHLLVVDLKAPGETRTVEVLLNGSEHGRYDVWLDRYGVASLQLRDLPCGQYSANLEGADDDRSCEFTVAEFKLAPLVASIVSQEYDQKSNTIDVRLRIETFGVGVDGRVRLDLHDTTCRASVEADARAGLAGCSFKLTSDGPFEIAVTLLSDPSKTASVALTGARASERSATVFSRLGSEISGSLMPSSGGRAVRGLYLDEGAILTSPFRLDRVDCARVRLVASGHIEQAVVVMIDPTYPTARPNAMDAEKADHPGLANARYREAERLFAEGNFAAAETIFVDLRTATDLPHPFYAYFAACCAARLGHTSRAIQYIRNALKDGWTDFAHLFSDSDLASLHGVPEFEKLRARGRVVREFENITPGAGIEIECPDPAGLLSIGALVEGSAWEGWAVVIVPPDVSPRVAVPDTPEPGTAITIRIETGTSQPAVAYLVVKDARLPVLDTPVSRFASSIKDWAREAGSTLMTGRVSDVLARIIPPPVGPPPMPAMFMPVSSPMPPGAAGGPWRGVPIPVAMAGAASTITGALPRGPAASPLDMMYMKTAGEEPPETGTKREMPADSRPPSVLHAELHYIENGSAEVAISLDNEFREYTAEVFVVRGLDWAGASARFSAEKATFASLDLPPFVHELDTAIGRLTFGAEGGRSRVSVTRDGEPVPLVYNGAPVESEAILEMERGELVFLAAPGEYAARVENMATGAVEESRTAIQEPGKLRSVARTVAFLQPGERISVTGDESILSIRVLPALDAPFKALVDATADYGHACCEQTAAKLLSACAMYALANGDGSRRGDAEAIIIAGVNREESMWLKGRGFKMYPESNNQPDTYWGPKAARYLWNLALLNGKGATLSPSLAAAVARGLEMARDTSKAYGFSWPLGQATSCEEAYGVVRFNGDSAARERALAVARAETNGESRHSGGYGAVMRRSESAFAAATLFRAGSNRDWPGALVLANEVVGSFGENGRLYSTADSVAAIALLDELQTAGVVTGPRSDVRVDERMVTIAEAATRGTSVTSVEATTGVVAVEVSRIVEEDWARLGSTVDAAFALEKQGRATRQFQTGDAIDLRVTLRGGYKAGDLLWVCLPDALSRISGGGQVKRFSMDFRGANELVIPLVATTVTVGRNATAAPQRFAACVRNMFEEERAGNPGLIEIQVSAPGDGGGPASGLARMYESIRNLFGGN